MVRKRRRNSQPDVYLACAVLLCAPCLLCWVLISKGLAHVPAPGIARMANRRMSTPVRPAVIRTPRRAIYPYSVIRGGAYSVAELQAALRVDPVAAAHYAVFDRSQMRVTQAPDSAAVYVSYRQGDRVYWTRRKLHLAAQESLLTDGVHTARARCGNRISFTPQEPTALSEPLPMELDLPELPPVAEPDEAETETGDLSMMVVDDVFPSLLGNVTVASLPDDSPGVPILVFAAGGIRFSGPRPTAPPLLAGLTYPTAPVAWPINFRPVPIQPFGPGFLGFQPIALPVIYETPERLPPSPPVWSLPSLPAGPPLPRPPGFFSPGLTVPGGSPPQVPRPPNVPLPAATDSPEPATWALLLGGAALLTSGRLSRRRYNAR